MWVAVSFSRSRSRAAGCGVEGADTAAVGVVGLRGGGVGLILRERLQEVVN